jgi:Timeless protein
MAPKTAKPRSAATMMVSPENNYPASTDRMKVSKEIVEELLLVCGVIGTTTEQDDELVPVTDCLNWLQDLQRALRRDDDQYRPISLLLSQWNIAEQKLLPLVLTARYDTAIVLTVCKILVILTKPLSDQAVRAGRMAIATQPKPPPKKVATKAATSGTSSIDITKEEEGGEEEDGKAKLIAQRRNQHNKDKMKQVFERYEVFFVPGRVRPDQHPPFVSCYSFTPVSSESKSAFDKMLFNKPML